MTWDVRFYGDVQQDILGMPPKIQARMIRLLEMIEKYGANLGAPHTKAMGGGLFEIRARAKEGIGRGFYCYMKGEAVMVLHAFVKKTQKTPLKELRLAQERLREVKQYES
ncbi:type II toxin-antitoxin system RelE/ParE family toxin [Marinobacter bohaiensis]|uniref:type II toxin-antitoxin system RelE/ParE family toxin n=1 Tax=Marinobacter bohaiensis TaxID=2201898 RepID=UPI000DAC0C27|nr:type II toxin-antitoxin system RelE/ParE family toxin [Marinobacter bohaiensis]